MKERESTAKRDYITYSHMDMLTHKYTVKGSRFYEGMSHSASGKEVPITSFGPCDIESIKTARQKGSIVKKKQTNEKWRW